MANFRRSSRLFDSPWLGGFCLVVSTFVCSLALQGILENGALSQTFLSRGLWARLIELLGGRVASLPLLGSPAANPEFPRIFLINLVGGLICWTMGGWLIAFRAGISFSRALGRWGVLGWLWGLVPAAWEIGRVLLPRFGAGNAAEVFLHATTPLWLAVALAGWLATLSSLIERSKPAASSEIHSWRGAIWIVVTAVLIYTAVFTAMNWQLYRNLLVPHGDSAMFEEHLWNLTHGKGFRSYLEDRLFLGEHIQVVHLFLLPFHRIWPSLMMLDFCESFALAVGAIPVFWMTKRHAKSAHMGLLAATAYLLYFPLHYLDIAIDLKTLRPIAFGVPALLYGLDQLERGRIKTAMVFWLIALSSKEDYAIILAPLGLWMACFPAVVASTEASASSRKTRLAGIGLAVLSTLYLAVAVKYVIPWFRGGEEVHYVGYFRQFGATLDEVVRNILGNPRLLFSELFAASTWVYAALLLVPLGGMALFSPSRLLVGLPLFGILCLNEIDKTPQHHFHAPLVAILFWATAAGMAKFPCRLPRRSQSQLSDAERILSPRWAGAFVLASAFSTSLFYSMSPLGIGFWDPHSQVYWKHRYVISERAKQFDLIYDDIPKTARVFSTDFAHPRFTHHARSYDYSNYHRGTDQELVNPIPGEMYYLVIDTGHPYSKIKTAADIPEYRDHPEDWELLPDKTNGLYIVLKRRN